MWSNMRYEYTLNPISTRGHIVPPPLRIFEKCEKLGRDEGYI